MLAQFRFYALALLMTAASGELVQAQRPSLNELKSNGAGGAELKQIYSQDVGTDYSVSSLNRIALSNARAQVNYYGASDRPQSPRVAMGLNANPGGSKPFAGYTPEPTVSPYLNLFREDLEGNSDLNYNTLVRPQLQQQQVNQQLQRQSLELARRLQSISAQSDFNPEGSKSQYPTGHQTVFMYYGHYYPSAAARPRR